MTGPLQGIVVLDLSRILAGPWATQVLADYGAEVLKIEHPQGGDDTRKWGPPYLEGRRRAATPRVRVLPVPRTAASARWRSTSAGPRVRRCVRQLARQADVLVENFKVGGLARYGLGYAELSQVNPWLVYLSISAFGQDGPDAAKPGYDAMIQGMGGLMSLTGVPDGEPGAGPQKVGVAVADLMCGMYAVSAILAALLRARTLGAGAVHRPVAARHAGGVARQPEPELPRVRHAAATTGYGAPEHRAVPGVRHGRRPPDARGRQRRAVRALLRGGRRARSWPRDSRFATNRERVAHRAQLVPRWRRCCDCAPPREWLAALDAATGALRADQRPRTGVRRAAGAPPRLAPRPAASARRHAPGVRNPVRFSRTAIDTSVHHLRLAPTRWRSSRRGWGSTTPCWPISPRAASSRETRPVQGGASGHNLLA